MTLQVQEFGGWNGISASQPELVELTSLNFGLYTMTSELREVVLLRVLTTEYGRPAVTVATPKFYKVLQSYVVLLIIDYHALTECPKYH